LEEEEGFKGIRPWGKPVIGEGGGKKKGKRKSEQRTNHTKPGLPEEGRKTPQKKEGIGEKESPKKRARNPWTPGKALRSKRKKRRLTYWSPF